MKKLITGIIVGTTLISFIFPIRLEIVSADEVNEEVQVIKNDWFRKRVKFTTS